MTITIPPFWCGVMATIAAELVLLIIAGIRARKRKGEDDNNDLH